ncbi:transmembrane protein 64-like isoform X2 [Dysidea avara]|uniref:transmembrane protein 64-like isoform X2 n=1 Tax=Dysidea avara TaxID=196820 RepID=UPI00331B317E
MSVTVESSQPLPEIPVHMHYVPVNETITESTSPKTSVAAAKTVDNDEADDREAAKKEEEDDGDLLEVFCSPVNLEQFVYEEEKEKDGSVGLVRRYCGVSVPFLIFLAVCVVFLVLCREYLLPFLDWLQKLPAAESIAVFILMFTVVSFPMTFGYIILNLAAGYLYGVIWGQVVVTTSVTAGMSIAFLICRSCCKDMASRWMDLRSVKAIIKVVESHRGFKVIALTRLTPIPFGLQNAMFSVLASVALMIYVVRRARRELASLTSEQDVEIGDNV